MFRQGCIVHTVSSAGHAACICKELPSKPTIIRLDYRTVVHFPRCHRDDQRLHRRSKVERSESRAHRPEAGGRRCRDWTRRSIFISSPPEASAVIGWRSAGPSAVDCDHSAFDHFVLCFDRDLTMVQANFPYISPGTPSSLSLSCEYFDVVFNSRAFRRHQSTTY